MSSNTRLPARTELVFAVPDLSCGRCVARIENALNACPEVRAVDVDLSARRVRVQVSATADHAPRTLLAVLAEAGYPAQRLDADAA